MENLSFIGSTKTVFTLDKAKELLPLIRRITHLASEDVKTLSFQFAHVLDKQRKKELEEEIRQVFEGWQLKMKKLGVQGKGMWLVDFDNGTGFYCWSFPEQEISYFHGYEEGFKGRIPIQ